MQRIYGSEARMEGDHVAVDRVWPRGITRDGTGLGDRAFGSPKRKSELQVASGQ